MVYAATAFNKRFTLRRLTMARGSVGLDKRTVEHVYGLGAANSFIRQHRFTSYDIYVILKVKDGANDFPKKSSFQRSAKEK